MKIITSVTEMKAAAGELRQRGERIAFVPTMGYLHEGHLALVREGRKRADVLVMSIFVNPTQFGAGEDFEKYPRDLERDARLAATAGIDVLFCPESREMYPDHYHTYVNVEEVTENLCGLNRPGHFRGVATICCKLFNVVRPHSAIFGKKDYQQLVVIKRMVADLNLDVEIIGLDTVREPDGLAMSSRNTYLGSEERAAALAISQSLLTAKELYDQGERDGARIREAVIQRLEASPLIRPDYVKIADVLTLKDLAWLETEALLAIAARAGQVRLIDNYVFGEPLKVEKIGNND